MSGLNALDARRNWVRHWRGCLMSHRRFWGDECCGQVDGAGACCAPACIRGAALKLIENNRQAYELEHQEGDNRVSVISLAYLKERLKIARMRAAAEWLLANPDKGAALIRAHAAGVDLFAAQGKGKTHGE